MYSFNLSSSPLLSLKLSFTLFIPPPSPKLSSPAHPLSPSSLIFLQPFFLTSLLSYPFLSSPHPPSLPQTFLSSSSIPFIFPCIPSTFHLNLSSVLRFPFLSSSPLPPPNFTLKLLYSSYPLFIVYHFPLSSSHPSSLPQTFLSSSSTPSIFPCIPSTFHLNLSSVLPFPFLSSSPPPTNFPPQLLHSLHLYLYSFILSF